MKKKYSIVIMVLFLYSSVILSCSNTSKNEDQSSKKQMDTPQYEWVFQSSDQAGEIAFKAQEAWADLVYQASNGRIKIQVTGAGSVVEHNQTLEAVGANIIQGDITDPSYFSGKDAAFSLIGNLIGAWSSPWDFIRFIYYGGGFKIYNELLNSYGVELLSVSTVGTEAFVSKKPIKNISDLQGVKLRAPEGLVQDLFRSLGASPVNLPGSEVYTSLEKGVIDASDYSIFARNQAQGMNDIGKYPIYPGWHSTPANQLTMNKKIFDSLPDDLKAILKAAGAYYSENFLLIHQDADKSAVREAKEKNSTIVSWSAEEIQKVREVAAQLWVKAAAQSPMAKKYYDTVVEYLQNQGMIRK